MSSVKQQGRMSEEIDNVQISYDFHTLYRTFHLKRNENKLVQKRDKNAHRSRKNRSKLLTDSITTSLPFSLPKISILNNCSSFASFASVRQIVLEYNFADSCRKWLIPLEDTDTANENIGRNVSPTHVPKIVGIGLEGVFQIIQESHFLYPELCIKALEALLKILEGQHPQSFKREPLQVIDSIFSMLLCLSKYEDSEPDTSSSKTKTLRSELSSLATACLLCLAIARGDTRSMLDAITSLFMCRNTLYDQELKNPEVLRALQRSTHAILVGRSVLPQWLKNGIPTNSIVDSFSVTFPVDPPGSVFSAKALASDGNYLYLHCSRGLYKIGSGSFGTIRGHIYQCNKDFHNSEKVWLGWASGKLYFRHNDTKIYILNEDTLEIKKSIDFAETVCATMFSDGVNIGMILPAKTDGFLVRTLCTETYTLESLNEFNLRLVRKSIEISGPSPWDETNEIRPVLTGMDDDIVSIKAGKDFALLRTQNGRILYCGKGSSLGQKSAGTTKSSKGIELGVSKCPRFIDFAVGHEAIHALLLGEDGSVYFVGTPKRGEDGDQSKARRVAKASKPKKVIRMEGHEVSFVACNNGTSAFVTRSGEVYLFGKDTAHCDPASGLLLGLRGIFISQIAIGKAHCVLLSSDGKIYTMGINNKGQCGRSLSVSKEDTPGTDIVDEEEPDWDDAGTVIPDEVGMCPSGSHRWKHEQCMVCTICRECTGYGNACISLQGPDRNPGQECGCGVGDAGCSECGICRTCAREDQDYIVMEPQQRPIEGLGDLIHLDKEEDEKDQRVDDNIEKIARSSKSSKATKHSKGKESSSSSSMTSFPPNRLILPTSFPIVQIACGLHHSIFLDSKGSVFVCGSNTFGQLGLNDLISRHTITKVRFPDENCKITQIAAGSNHSVALDSNGHVFTCGGRQSEIKNESLDTLWFAKMTALENIGANHGRRVTWIGAGGESTFLRIEASLISQKLLKKSTVTANASSIMIIPPPNSDSIASTILINRRDGNCTYFDGIGQITLNTSAVTLDPLYDFLWTYEWRRQTMSCYNVIASNVRNNIYESNMWLLKLPYAIPMGSKLKRWQAAASLLALMDTLVSTQLQGLQVNQEEQSIPAMAKMYGKDDYSSANRFESNGGGWGYSGHSVEAIRFSCDSDVLVGGLGLFGGRGEYSAKIKVYDIGQEGGEAEIDGELVVETEEVPFECNPRQKYRAMLDEPISIQAGRWYVAWVHISGPSSDCGSGGLSSVLTDDQVLFQFKSSKKSNNGTDVNAGQIASILYRIINPELNCFGTKPRVPLEITYILNNDFLNNFPPGSVQVLISLIDWCWEEIHSLSSKSVYDSEDLLKFDLLKFFSCSALRLVEFSINQVYPFKGCGRLGQMENLSMTEAIGDARSMIHNMMSTELEPSNEKLANVVEGILFQCCDTFVNCFQIFYPTSTLKWECLANFMYLFLKKGTKYSRILSKTLKALLSCRGLLLGIFPLLNTIVRQSPDETNLTFVTNTEGGKLKQQANNRLLVSQMAIRNDLEDFVKPIWNFWEILQYLLTLVGLDRKENHYTIKSLVNNSSLLLAKIVEELVSHASGVYSELENVIGNVIVATPSRFTRTNQTKTWNTGNGSPDAVCFEVDQPGVSIFGACIFSGTGPYEYDLEIFQEVIDEIFADNNVAGPKWLSLDSTKGTFDSEDCIGDIAEIRFSKPVHIKPGVKYAIRLKNQGGRTCNGDGGVSTLKCPDGITFTFTSCPLSFNGTNQIRGQIPHVLYFRNPDDSDARQKAKALTEMQAKKCTERICSTLFENAKVEMENVSLDNINDLVNCSLVTTLLPSVLAHLPNLAVSDPRSSLELLELIQSILPLVSEINNKIISKAKCEKHRNTLADSTNQGVYYAWVESPHPYKPASVTQYRITFPSSVQRMAIEFDPRCSTAQPEDVLRLYIPFGGDLPFGGDIAEDIDYLSSWIPIVEKYYGNDTWPKNALIIPGNEILFSMETSSDYAKADRSQYFGFKCLVRGFEWKELAGLSRLEMELAFLGGFCAHELIKKDLVLPPVSVEEVDTSLEASLCEEKMIEICMKHQALFSKGIGLEYFPPVKEALDGIVPLREKSKEREFIADFIARRPGSGGERLCHWLQPESSVDPQNCEVVISKETIRRGKPTVLVIVTRDQYSEPVVSTNLQVEVKAVPTDSGSCRKFPINTNQQPQQSSTTTTTTSSSRKISSKNDSSDSQFTPYQPTIKDKARYHAITMMKDYENKSFEELRFMSPSSRQISESMLVRQNNNATYTATWTPTSSGLYDIFLLIDGYTVSKGKKIEVEEANIVDESISGVKKNEDHSGTGDQSFGGGGNNVDDDVINYSKMRKFKANDSAGLRIRSQPSLQSEQIGILPVNGVITFTQELHNDDGIWVKLDEESVYSFAENTQAKNFKAEGWCLQYNQHLGKTLLFPIESPRTLPGGFCNEKNFHSIRKQADSPFSNEKSSKVLKLNGSPGIYTLIKCGVSGHNIRTRPCLRAPPVGILVLGTKIYIVDECFNSEGLWVKLDQTSQRKCCFTSEGEAWTLAMGNGDISYLKRIDVQKDVKGFDFSVASQYIVPQSIFQNSLPVSFSSSQSQLSLNSNQDLHHESLSSSSVSQTNIKPLTTTEELERAELFEKRQSIDGAIKAIKEEDDKGNNGKECGNSSSCPSSLETFQDNSSSKMSSKKESKRTKSTEQDSPKPRSKSSSTFGALQKWLQIGNDSKSSPNNSSGSGLKQSTSDIAKQSVKGLATAFIGERKVSISTATQTSPKEEQPSSSSSTLFPTTIQFNMGSVGPSSLITSIPSPMSSAKNSPKVEKRHKGTSSSSSRSKRREKDCGGVPKSQYRNSFNTADNMVPQPQNAHVKEAISPGQSQCQRAVFGAILWHAGLIHDAMVCANHLRFIKQTGNIMYEQTKEKENDKSDIVKDKDEKASTSAVILRKKSSVSPNKSNQLQRHSVEVASASRYLEENPGVILEPLEFTILSSKTENEKEGQKSHIKPPTTWRDDDKSSEEFPPAMIALEKIWNHVKAICSDSLFKEKFSASVNFMDDGNRSVNGTSSAKVKRSKVLNKNSPLENVGKTRREKRHIQASLGKGNILEQADEQIEEFVEEIQQCEMCHVRFHNKGRSKKAHFGLSSLCESCTERQLRLKKQPNMTPKTELELGFRQFSPKDTGQNYSYVLNNALFLLQMINSPPDSQFQIQDPHAQKFTLNKSFNCFNSLGVSEYQIKENENDDLTNLDPNIYATPTRKKIEYNLRTIEAKKSVGGSSDEADNESNNGGSGRKSENTFIRKRKTSNGDQLTDSDEQDDALLNHPSPALQKIIDASKNNGEQEAIEKLCSSVLNFTSEKHDLESLKLFIFQAIRRIICRSYGMQALASMMRNVSQTSSLHDLFWWFASSFEYKETENPNEKDGGDNGWWQLRDHPLSESLSPIFPLLSDSFYTLLQTISDIMPYLPVGSPLLEMAVKSWGISFNRNDHRFLHKSKIFRNLSKIMSQFDSEGDRTNIGGDSIELQDYLEDEMIVSSCLADITQMVDLKVSSRVALVASLTDSSTETFWETGDEDRNRTKTITVVVNNDLIPKVVSIYIDNGRDAQYKVSSISIKVGPHSDEFTKIGHIDLDSKLCGWSWFSISSDLVKVIKIELKGPDNTLRVRQIKILGSSPQPTDTMSNLSISRRKCENETLRIFRLLSSEVFGKLLDEAKMREDDGLLVGENDLQEHVVGILFSRNKLSHLQKQVCSHIVNAIHRESAKIKEDFDNKTSGSILEATNEDVKMIYPIQSKTNDRYCFEMLSLVLALAGSQVGRSYLSHQSNLIQDLVQLLHAGTARIQRQVISVLRKILPEIYPQDLAKIISYQDEDISTRLGILDMLLGCVVKSLQVRVRTSTDGNRFARNININDIFTIDELPLSYWFLRGEVDIQLANSVVKLIKDMCDETFSKNWAQIIIKAIQDAVIHFTSIEAEERNSVSCLNSPKFWIALAALCVLHDDHPTLLSSPLLQNNGLSGRAKCLNHDDGETLAVIHCNECLDLCVECDRILHLPKKAWDHKRKICKEEEESIKVDLHEGCGRIKLFWLMALADSSTLKALIEFRNGVSSKGTSEAVSNFTTYGRCRFCNKTGNSGPLALGNVCGEVDCQENAKIACEKVLECGHLCGGVRDEIKCLPCLQGCSDKLGIMLKQDADDMCMICFTDALSTAPSIQLLCNHVYHYNCAKSILDRRWSGPRITFSFSFCPICKVEIFHNLLINFLTPIRELFTDVQRKALMRLEYEGLNKADAIVLSGGRFYQDPAGYAMDRYAYYVCYKCKKAYFGGEARCDIEILSEYDPSELVCGGCSDVAEAQLCPKHGTDYLEYKCRYCCSVAVFFCFGTTHFCNGCHDNFQSITAMSKSQLPHCPTGPRAKQLDGDECPLHVSHPPTGEEFALGCGICRNTHFF